MDQVVEEFEWFADWANGVTPLYERLARQTARENSLLEIAAEAPSSQPAPNLLFGAVHALLLAGVDHPLVEFYPTCTDDAVDPTTRDPFPAFREFCLSHEDRIREIVGSRRVQTNEVGRSAVLFPAFKSAVDRGAATPIALVEIGTSAGLNLYWDRFRYEYEGYAACGDPESPVTIETTVRGDGVPPRWDRPPEIARRVGIDVNPLDVTDPADARWLRALVIPDQAQRFERLDDAIELVADDPPQLVAGDALEVLPDVLSEIPDRFDVFVFSTLVLYQLDDHEIETLRDLLIKQSQRRTVHWFSNDPSREETPPTYRYVSFADGQRTRRLAKYKAHGEWIRWLADSST
ncbi:DUF2332 domain-containing protein [Natronobacterium texcoconense]|nr:DUF2332 domain-containing protein [Natronobacterium texcoconense]